ncbi:MAG: PAS domain S-box protein [Methanoregula sp.]|nr:PAS domain S-box protein [Methanoregula sp.]
MADVIRVLYVDDEPDLLDIGKLFLESDGVFAVDTLTSAVVALEQLKMERYDAIISDYQMPEMNGIQFLLEVRTRFGQIPYILFTGRGREEVVIQAINSGVDFYLQKGGDPGAQFAELSHKIRAAVERSRNENAFRESEERFRGITERISDLIIVVDTDGYATFVSPSITPILGFLPDSYIGKRASPDIIPASDVANIGKAIERLKNGSPGEQLEFRMKKSNGSYAVFDGRGIPVFKEGVYSGAQVVARDITARKLAEEGLQESEEKYRLAAEKTGQLVYDYDIARGKIRWSGAIEQVTGYTSEEFQLVDIDEWKERIHPDDWSSTLAGLNAAIERGAEYRVEYRFRKKDGSYISMESCGSFITDASGKACRMIGTQKDLSLKKQMEIDLRQSEEKFKTLFKGANDAIFIADRSVFLDCNHGTEVIFGLSRDQFIGRSLKDFSPERQPDGRLSDEKAEELIDAALSGEPRFFEWVYLRADRTPFFAEVSLNRILLRGMYCVQAIVRDISDRKRAEERLLQQTDAMEAAIDGMALLDKDQNYIYMNRAHAGIYGYDNPQELIGKSWRVIYDAGELFRFEQEIMPAFLQKGYFRGRAQGRKKDNSLFPQEVSLTALDNGRMICVVRDITGQKQMEDAVFRRTALFEALAETSPDGILVINEKNERIQINERLITMWKIPADILNDPNDEALLRFVVGQTQNPDLFYKKVMALYKHPEEISRDIVEFSDGRVYDRYTAPVIDRSGCNHGRIWTFRDISEQKAGEAEIKAAQDQFELIFNTSPDIAVIARLDDGRIVTVNEGFTAVTGYTRNEAIGKTTVDLGIWINPGERQNFIDKLIEKGSYYYFEAQLKSKDGRQFPSLVSANITNLHGVLHVFTITRDITERKRMEEALRESEGKFRGLAESLNDVVMRIDRNHCHLYVNQAIEVQTGIKPELMMGKRHRELGFPEDLVKGWEEMTDSVFATGERRQKVFQLPNGHWIDIVAVPEHTVGGEIACVIMTGRDITERKQARDALQQVNKKLNLLSGITRHDITNQLAVLQGYRALLEKKQTDPGSSEYFQKINMAAQRIAAMIQFTREYEQIGVNVPVWRDCRTLVDTAATEAPLGHIRVKNAIPQGTEVFADPLIARVFYNLLDNAVRHGGKITTILFSVQESGAGRIIICEDDGEGVSAADKEMIFERGFGKNTGLGLALSREILDITGIIISETGEPGKGARFEMMVPKGMWRMTGNDA